MLPELAHLLLILALLAPAAASFDQYPNFEKRGEDFTARVKAMIGN